MNHSKKGKYALDTEEYLTVLHFALQYKTLKKNKEYNAEKIRLIEETAQIAGDDIAKWLLKGVTEKRSYDNLHLVHGLPCGKDYYYIRKNHFYWLLNEELNKIIEGGRGDED